MLQSWRVGPVDSVWINSITLFEVRFGLALLPIGRHRQTLEAAVARLLNFIKGPRRAPQRAT